MTRYWLPPSDENTAPEALVQLIGGFSEVVASKTRTLAKAVLRLSVNRMDTTPLDRTSWSILKTYCAWQITGAKARPARKLMARRMRDGCFIDSPGHAYRVETGVAKIGGSRPANQKRW